MFKKFLDNFTDVSTEVLTVRTHCFLLQEKTWQPDIASLANDSSSDVTLDSVSKRSLRTEGELVHGVLIRFRDNTVFYPCEYSESSKMLKTILKLPENELISATFSLKSIDLSDVPILLTDLPVDRYVWLPLSILLTSKDDVRFDAYVSDDWSAFAVRNQDTAVAAMFALSNVDGDFLDLSSEELSWAEKGGYTGENAVDSGLILQVDDEPSGFDDLHRVVTVEDGLLGVPFIFNARWTCEESLDACDVRFSDEKLGDGLPSVDEIAKVSFHQRIVFSEGKNAVPLDYQSLNKLIEWITMSSYVIPFGVDEDDNDTALIDDCK